MRIFLWIILFNCCKSPMIRLYYHDFIMMDAEILITSVFFHSFTCQLQLTDRLETKQSSDIWLLLVIILGPFILLISFDKFFMDSFFQSDNFLNCQSTNITFPIIHATFLFPGNYNQQ